MFRTDDIIEAYLEADCEKRLLIYLQYPLLRDEFVKIELTKNPTKSGIKDTRGKSPDRSFRSRWHAAMGHCCLKLRGS